MISFVESKLRYSDQTLAESDVIFIQDHHYDEVSQCFPVQSLLENSSRTHTLLFDHVLQHDDCLRHHNMICLPIFLSRTVNQFIKQNIEISWDHKPYQFNFMINKPRLHREFLLLLIQHFGLSNFTYTLCGKHNRIDIELLASATTNHLYQQIINSTQLDIPVRQFLLGHENLMNRGLHYGHVTNSENYNCYLQKNLFEPSRISLITEPAFFERETIITEKTVMAIWGGTIPIWVGGWCIPNYMKSLGFDIFEDIVDHDYQLLPDPMDRCYHAIARNLGVLQHPVSANLQQRLQHNLDLLLDNCFKRIILDRLPGLDSNIVDLVQSLIEDTIPSMNLPAQG
jgi:hypothetical protein